MRDLIINIGGHKFRADDLVHLQAGYKEAVKILCEAFLGLDPSLLSPYSIGFNNDGTSKVNEGITNHYLIVSGCIEYQNSKNEVVYTPGWIYWCDDNTPNDRSRIKGELIYFPGINIGYHQASHIIGVKKTTVTLEAWPPTSDNLPLEIPRTSFYEEMQTKEGQGEIKYANGRTNDVHVLSYFEVDYRTYIGSMPSFTNGYTRLDTTNNCLSKVLTKIKVLSSVNSDSSDSSVNSDKVDNLHGTQFLRNDNLNQIKRNILETTGGGEGEIDNSVLEYFDYEAENGASKPADIRSKKVAFIKNFASPFTAQSNTLRLWSSGYITNGFNGWTSCHGFNGRFWVRYKIKGSTEVYLKYSTPVIVSNWQSGFFRTGLDTETICDYRDSDVLVATLSIIGVEGSLQFTASSEVEVYSWGVVGDFSRIAWYNQ